MSQKLHTMKDIEQVASVGKATLYPDCLKISIGSATCGLAMGARKIEEAVVKTLKEFKKDALVTRTGCIGRPDESIRSRTVFPRRRPLVI